MADGDVTQRDDGERTRPPPSNLRFETPYELYAAIPQIREVMHNRPRDDEDALGFLLRLRGSTTPEETMTFTAFAARPKLSIWWAYECLRTTPAELTEEERRMLTMIANWTNQANDENRYEVMKAALFSNTRTPAVILGLAVGWSGGPAAPNDLGTPPAWKCPRMVSTAVLLELTKVGLAQRSVTLARYIDLAGTVFRKS